MKEKKKIFIIVAVVAVMVIGIGAVLLINYLNRPKHNITGKTYHISSDKCYYIEECEHCENEPVEVEMDFIQLLHTVDANDKIVLDENLELSNIILDGYNTLTNQIKTELNINLDLNSYSISSNLENSNSVKSLIQLRAISCSINLNIKNGTLNAGNLLYVFDFNNSSSRNIALNLDTVTCETVGYSSTPLFAQDTSSNMKITAKDCEFMAYQSNFSNGNQRVGAFINSESEFNFNNCYFLGGDAIYIKAGTVNLTGCTLVNKDLGNQGDVLVSTATFSPAGRCLVADSYNYTEAGINKVSKFNITIDKCVFNAETSNVAILISESGNAYNVNSTSSINIKSAKFNSSNITSSLNKSIVTLQSSIQNIGENLYQIGNM